MTDDLKPYDPRPEWLQLYHKQVDSGADQFKEWAVQNLNIDIDDQLKYDQGTGKAGIAQQRFCVVIPKLRIIVIYAHAGNQSEYLTDKQFQNRIKMLYVIYPQFSPVSPELLKSALELAISQWKDAPPKQLPGI